MCYSRLCAMWTQSPQEWTHSYLHISEGHYAAIHNHAVRDYFNLCCGVLLGQFLDKGWSHRVTAIVPCTNVHPEPTQRFRIALEQLAQIGRETDGSNEEIVGVYFSYPDGSEYTQSVLDTYQLWGMAYVAVRIASDSSTNEMTSWKLIGPENAKRFQRQTIIIAKTREQVQDRAAALATSEPPATSVPPGSGLDKLNALVGLPKLKDEVRRMVASVKVQQARKKHGMKTHQSSLHMVFTGNPGTGKTTVARLIAEIYGEIGVLSKGHLVETDRAGLVGQWVGSTALKTVEIVNAAIGGILFIDEAYSLMPAGHGHDFAAEAIATLLKLMEDYRDDLVVIIAGYPNEMQKFIDTNPGLASRFAKHLHFEDYTTKDLLKIFVKFCEDSDYDVDPDDWDSMRRKVEQVFEGERRGNTTNFANGRFVRNVFEHTIARQAVRIANGDLSRINLQFIRPDDVPGIEHEEPEASHNLLLSPENQRQACIFVVDDEEAIRDVICEMLSWAGYECQAFAGGRDALAALETGERCELLLTDLLNALMDGETLLKCMKKQFPTIPVVVATAVHDDFAERDCIQNGAYEYLREPFERKQLLDVVHRALKFRNSK